MKMKTKKRFLCILLSIVLLLGLLPGMSMTAYATERSSTISIDGLAVGDTLVKGAAISTTANTSRSVILVGGTYYKDNDENLGGNTTLTLSSVLAR